MRNAALAVCLVLTACHTDTVVVPGSGASAGASSTATPLPAAFKGYELYAWDDAGEIAFTLVTGTNRQKTADELRNPEAQTTDDYVQLRGTGLDDLRGELARVPSGTDVIFSEHPDLPALDAAARAEVEAAVSAR